MVWISTVARDAEKIVPSQSFLHRSGYDIVRFPGNEPAAFLRPGKQILQCMPGRPDTPVSRARDMHVRRSGADGTDSPLADPHSLPADFRGEVPDGHHHEVLVFQR